MMKITSSGQAITQYEPDATHPQVSKQELDIIQAAATGKRIEHISKEGLVKLVSDLLNTASFRLGHRNNFEKEAEKAIVMDMIIKDMQSKFYGFTAAEIKIAWEKGLNGDFKKSENEIIIVSPASFVKWMKAYKEEAKPEAIRKHALYLKKAEEKPVPPLSEQLRIFKEALLYYFNKMKEDNAYQFEDHGNAFYNRLESLGLINITLELKKKIYEEEKVKIRNFPDLQNSDDRMLFDQWISNTPYNGHHLENPFEARLKSNCKKRVLSEYLLGLIEMEIDFESLLKEAITERLKSA